jgi:hypothetical protein
MLQAVAMDLASADRVTATPGIIIPADRAAPTDHAGLGVALQRAGWRYSTGARTIESIECLGDVMRSSLSGREQFTVSPEATWTLNALAAGYCREGQGAVILGPKDGISKTVAQALEALGRMTSARSLAEDSQAELTGLTRDGRQYRSMLGRTR